MIDPEHFATIADMVRAEKPAKEIDEAARNIQRSLNPHPSGQVAMNVPNVDGEPMPGMQHKYDETVLFFPAQGQTCHAYCTYCFRWPQFVKLDDLKFATKEGGNLVRYLRAHPEATDVLFTGGDPMIMRTDVLRRYIEPLLEPEFQRVTIRIGTKAGAYWPHRFVDDKDAEDTLRLFDDIAAAGNHLAIMGHYSHPVELATEASEKAVRNILNTGAVIRCQAPLIRHVNDDSKIWADMIRRQVKMGCIPYYMFVERDTGAKRYFELPLERALEVYNGAFRDVSGLGRTMRGPSMSATPGKVQVLDIMQVNGEKVFALRMLQGRNADWTNRIFFAAYDPRRSGGTTSSRPRSTTASSRRRVERDADVRHHRRHEEPRERQHRPQGTRQRLTSTPFCGDQGDAPLRRLHGVGPLRRAGRVLCLGAGCRPADR